MNIRGLLNLLLSSVQSPALNCFIFLSLLWVSGIFGCGKFSKTKKRSSAAKCRVKANPKTPNDAKYSKQTAKYMKTNNEDSNTPMASGMSPASADMKSPMRPQGSETTKPNCMKDEKLAKGLIVRRQSDYPAMNGELSDSVISSDLPKDKNCSSEDDIQILARGKKTRAEKLGKKQKKKNEVNFKKPPSSDEKISSDDDKGGKIM